MDRRRNHGHRHRAGSMSVARSDQPAPPLTPARLKPELHTRFLSLLNLFGPFIGLVLVFGLFSLSAEVRPYLFTGANFKIILLQTVIVAIGALGMTMIIVSGGIDLSVGSSVALSSVVGAILVNKGYSPISVVLVTILAGAAVGMVNGAMIAWFRMMPFIVTLGMMGIARGLA